MIVKIPPTIEINIDKYTVHFKPDLILLDNTFGECDHINLRIDIDPKSPHSIRAATLLHEVIHIIDRVYKCHLDDDTIDRLARGMAEFLCKNLGIEFDWDAIPEASEKPQDTHTAD